MALQILSTEQAGQVRGCCLPASLPLQRRGPQPEGSREPWGEALQDCQREPCYCMKLPGFPQGRGVQSGGGGGGHSGLVGQAEHLKARF